MKPIKILIADDHRDFRRVVHEFLDRLPNVSVIGEACDGDEAVEQVEKLTPDIVLMDIHMPVRSGLDATRDIKDRFPQTKVVVLSMYTGELYRTMAGEAHADGFIEKQSMKSELLAMIQQEQ